MAWNYHPAFSTQTWAPHHHRHYRRLVEQNMFLFLLCIYVYADVVRPESVYANDYTEAETLIILFIFAILD